MRREKWTTTTVADLLGIRPARLHALIWNRALPEPPRKANGLHFDWTTAAVQRVCRALHGVGIRERQAARRSKAGAQAACGAGGDK